MAQRLAKVHALRQAAAGVAYPNDFAPSHTAAQAMHWFSSDPVHLHPFVALEQGAPMDLERPPPAGAPVVFSPRVHMAGRVLAINVKGKVAFLRVIDRTAAELPGLRAAENRARVATGLPERDVQVPTFQFYFSRDDDPDTFDRLFKPTEGAPWEGPLCDVGDIVGGEGLWFRTRTGEQSLWLKSAAGRPALRILTKAVRPLPDKFHGLADKETRLRQRYVDLVMNQDVREIFRKRSMVLRGVRRFLDDRGYVEVETPMMHTSLGGAAARPFRTHHNALDMPLYLRIAPELHLKRLVVGGIERVYEINRNFRNEGLSQRHNPEFTMLEFYRAYATYTDLMDEVEALIAELALQVCGSTTVHWGSEAGGTPREIRLAAPFARVRIADGLQRWAGIAEAGLGDERVLRARAAELGVHIDGHATLGKVQVELFEAVAEPHLVQPTFVYEYPAETSPLARRNDRDGGVVDRFELFIGGIEISNAFSELNDPVDQYQRFAHQLDQRAKGDEETMDLDIDYVRALEYGMPPAAGCGIGIDRLVMLLSGAESIREVILFPHMRPEGAGGGERPSAEPAPVAG
ncbi:MAG: lysine--tRNA ligase [Deltaproteobacteria bacterium]|nr:lysine--tRNA ligase [Deltaproteobacteria bacterium]